MSDRQKAAVIGCGFVGAAISYSLMESGLFSELILLDLDADRAEGEAMDISHGVPFSRPMRVAAGDYDALSDAFLVIVTAGVNQKPNETRLQLVQRNAAILRDILKKLRAVGFDGILLIVSNPVDVLTELAVRESGLPAARVIGSGTVLDTARLKYELGQYLQVDSRSVHAFIVGEHGDSEIALLSSANVSGVLLPDFCRMRGYFEAENQLRQIAQSVKNSAYAIMQRKQATYYGIASAVRRICTAIVRDEKSILPVSSHMRGGYNIDGISLSLPAILGASGIEKLVPVSMDQDERFRLQESAALLQKVISAL